MMMFGLALSIIAGGVVADGTGNAAQAASQETAIAKISKIQQKFNENRAYQTIYHLSETIGPRVTGTAEEKERRFIASQMKSQI
ncbi:hypothetical protein PO124_04500 [Bacillus licheniformis]|nr:hypothetical protein [Bacillus licheniformis]